MRRIALSPFSFTLTLLATAALAQNIDGHWQGTLQGEQRSLRLVMKVTSAGDGTLQAVFYNIDQSGQGFAASSANLQGSTFKAAIPAIGATYEGKLDPTGAAISGTFTQQGAPRPLTLVKATAATAWAIPDPPAPRQLMSEDARPSFEVATIKPGNPATPGRGVVVGRGGGNSFATRNTTLSDLIQFAYVVHEKQVIGGPSWIETEKFDLLAKPDTPGVPNAPQLRAMLQKLLADRFGLRFHREKKELSAYVLAVGKDGVKMARAEGARSRLPGFAGRGPGALGARNATIADFAQFLQSRVLERPVVDQSGLADRYDFTLEWKPDSAQPAASGEPNPPSLAPNVEDRPDLLTAIRQQLGLAIESRKLPVEVLVVDKVERPSEN